MFDTILHDYRTCQVFPIRYHCIRQAQQILDYALSVGPHDWNNRTVEEREEDADRNSIVGK